MYLVLSGQAINAEDINQLARILQEQSGGTETGKYWVSGASYTNGALIAQYMPSLSRGATPVSVSVNEVDQAHNNCGAINADHLTSSGFHLYSFGSGTFQSANVGGSFTIQF